MKKTESRYYKYYDDFGKERHKKVTYGLWFKDGVLTDVVNEFGFTVEKNSECWEFFNNKYNT
jgi:hypothetical protein